MNSRRAFLSGISSAAVSLSFTRRSTAGFHHGGLGPGYDVFALFGQSNHFGGFGGYNGAIDIGDPKLFSLGQHDADNNVVIPGIDPLQFLGAFAPSSIGFSVAFARDHYTPLSLAAGRNVLLVPCAVGGTGFSNPSNQNWTVGGAFYELAIARTNTAMATNAGNVLKAIFFQGGEADQFVYTQAQYIALFQAMASDARSRITGASSATPILIGGESPATTTHFGFTVDTQTYLQNMPASVTNSYYVDSFLPFPLTTDNRVAGVDPYDPITYVHYDCPSQRELGSRYHAVGVANGLWAG